MKIVAKWCGHEIMFKFEAEFSLKTKPRTFIAQKKKTVLGLVSEPIYGHNFATYSKSAISIFDRRYLPSDTPIPLYDIVLYVSLTG